MRTGRPSIAPALRDTVSYPEKRYAARFYCEDGSEVDLTAARRQDQAGLVVAYYHTTVEYMDSFSLSITSMLSGYDQENNGIIVVSNGSDIIASNDPTLIGSSTDDLEILRKIKAEGVSDKLVQAKQNCEEMKRQAQSRLKQAAAMIEEKVVSD